jgi:integrase
VNPYTRHIESFTQKSRDRILQTISFEEIKKIKSLKHLPLTLENARKWMLIGLYIGQRVSDLLILNPSQLRFVEHGVYVDITQQKTDKNVTIGVVDLEVIKILKYKFPYSISAQMFNRQIKQVCQIAGINEMVSGYKLCPKTRRKKLGTHPKSRILSSHDLRRSFATNYFGKIETPILMQITGHSKESTFLSYIGTQVNKDTYADAFMKIAATL